MIIHMITVRSRKVKKNVQLGTRGHDPSGGGLPPPGQRIVWDVGVIFFDFSLYFRARMELSMVSSDRSHRADRFRPIESSAAKI